ncbi:Serine racemase [Geodia barretti]|uniref:Serine racemase n=1 Tax=Geodia barretti TaxID=519541 RepID=A0AA35WBW4_GEOBA|nr:Serine racemase [Geodia barretti]
MNRGHCGDNYFVPCREVVPISEARVRTCEEVMERLGPSAVLVPSSNHPDIMAGQGTIATEFLAQVPDLDVIVGSVSVGGMLAGISVAAKSIRPVIKVVAAEPKNADDIARSFAAGRRIVNESPPTTVADALRMSVGDIVWPVLLTNLTGVVTVSEHEIISTNKLVWERLKLVIEPSAAVAVAAVLSPQFGEVVGSLGQLKVGVVLCGGNMNLDHLPWMTS